MFVIITTYINVITGWNVKHEKHGRMGIGKLWPKCLFAPRNPFTNGTRTKQRNFHFKSQDFCFVTMKKIFAALAATVLSISALSVSAQTLQPPTIAAKSWLLLDASANQVIASSDAVMRVEPASLTKLMTAYIAFAALRVKRLSQD